MPTLQPRGSLAPEVPKSMRFILPISLFFIMLMASATPAQTRHTIQLSDATNRALRESHLDF